MKKVILVVLAFVLIFSMVGCSSPQTEEKVEESKAPATQESTETESTEKSVADDYPSKPIEVIVAYKAGGGN